MWRISNILGSDLQIAQHLATLSFSLSLAAVGGAALTIMEFNHVIGEVFSAIGVNMWLFGTIMSVSSAAASSIIASLYRRRHGIAGIELAYWNVQRKLKVSMGIIIFQFLAIFLAICGFCATIFH